VLTNSISARQLILQTDPTKISIDLQPSVSSGITLQNITNNSSFLLKFKNQKISRIGNAKGVTGSGTINTGLRFVNANIFVSRIISNKFIFVSF
jgi:hypothetical protein